MAFAEFFPTTSTCKIHVSAKDLKEKRHSTLYKRCPRLNCSLRSPEGNAIAAEPDQKRDR